jgi:hypothetical protein
MRSAAVAAEGGALRCTAPSHSHPAATHLRALSAPAWSPAAAAAAGLSETASLSKQARAVTPRLGPALLGLSAAEPLRKTQPRSEANCAKRVSECEVSCEASEEPVLDRGLGSPRAHLEATPSACLRNEMSAVPSEPGEGPGVERRLGAEFDESEERDRIANLTAQIEQKTRQVGDLQ